LKNINKMEKYEFVAKLSIVCFILFLVFLVLFILFAFLKFEIIMTICAIFGVVFLFVSFVGVDGIYAGVNIDLREKINKKHNITTDYSKIRTSNDFIKLIPEIRQYRKEIYYPYSWFGGDIVIEGDGETVLLYTYTPLNKDEVNLIKQEALKYDFILKGCRWG